MRVGTNINSFPAVVSTQMDLIRASSLLLLIVCALSITLFSGCSDSEKTAAKPPLTEEEIKKQKEEEAFKKLPKTKDGRVIITNHDLLKKYHWRLWEADFPLEEPLDNKEFWSKTRIMFTWHTRQMVNGEKMNTRMILSANLDGTDIRKVLTTELLMGDNEADMMHKPARSPNNRYLIAYMSGPGKKEGSYKVLYDLKNMTSEIIAYGGSAPDFNWAPDSENIYFYNNGDLKKYNIVTKIMSDMPMIYSSGGQLFLRNNGKTFVAARDSQLQFNDIKGNRIKNVDFPTKRGDSELHVLSTDGRYLYYRDDEGQIVDTLQQQLVYSYPSFDKSPRYMVFNPYTNEAIFRLKNKGLVSHNFITDKQELLVPITGFVLMYGDIINYPPIYKNSNQ